jgi:outer membrane protein assembly factor BamA
MNNFDELHYDVFVTLGKRFTIYENVGVSLGYQIVDVSEKGPGRTISADGTDRFLSGAISYSYDSRNLRDYTTQGWLYSAYISKIGFGESDISFTRLGADIRWFAPLTPDLTIGSRAHGSIVSGGKIPTYARSYFGYGERIRGYYKNVFEGENIAGTSVELRWQLVAPRIVKFEAIPLPQEFSIWRLGLSLELFADAGTTWFRGESISLRSFASGYGGGVVFLLPYDIVVRTEYAWNDLGRGQFIFGVRSTF